MAVVDQLRECVGFQWDAGNSEKNWHGHQVSRGEVEEAFFNHPLMIGGDPVHSSQESRFYMLGQTNAGRRLFVAFTIRVNLICIISARDMSRRERRVYEAAE